MNGYRFAYIPVRNSNPLVAAPESVITLIICETCSASSKSGEPIAHVTGCAKGAYQPPKRRITEITRVMHYKMIAEIAPDGSVIMP